MPFGDTNSLFYKNLVKGGCKTNKSRFLDSFKSYFDTASLKISTRAFRIRIQISKRSIVRRVMVILLQEKNFGPNVRYCVLGCYFAVSFWSSLYRSTSYARTSLRRAKNEKTLEKCGLLDPTKSEGITRGLV